MKVLKLDAGRWKTMGDFYDALLAAIQAPRQHGRGLDALIDSMIYGGINGIEPPYRIEVTGGATIARDAATILAAAILSLGDAGGAKEGIEFHTDPMEAVWFSEEPFEPLEHWPSFLRGVPPIETLVSGDGNHRVQFVRLPNGAVSFFAQDLRRQETEGQEYFVWEARNVSGLYPDLETAKRDAARSILWLESPV